MGDLREGGKSILVIEDDPDVRDLLTYVLETEGYRVRTASNGVTGLAHLRSRPAPCVVLLDLAVPVMDGWQFRAEQLKDERLARVPVLIVSGHPSIVQQARSMRVAGYVRKPIDTAQLVELVKQHC